MTGPVRPGFHVTPPAGWINDPLGVSWRGGAGRYELFVQYLPDAPEWAPACRWGQLSAPDLVRWSWVGTALAPAGEEAGCWSGSVAVDDAGTPVIVYTSVRGADLDLGRIALATGEPGWRRWTADPGRPVLPGPPPELDLRHFRDPFVWRDGAGWRMVVGGGAADGRAVALQYSSPDLRGWTFDGVLAERSAADREPLWTGSVWECVQLFPLEGRWVLLLSVWHAGQAHRVVGAVGDYDGRRFTPHSWQRFTATDAIYATTAFTDAEGRRGALSWVREPAAPGPEWAGVLSLPVLLGLDGDRLTVVPHPDVDTLRTGVLARLGPTAGPTVELGPFDPFLDVVLEPDPAGGPVQLTVTTGTAALLEMQVDPADGAVVLGRPDRPAERVPRVGAEVRLLLDADVAEVFTGGAAGVVRTGPAGPVRLAVSAPDGRGRLRRLTVHGMPARGTPALGR